MAGVRGTMAANNVDTTGSTKTILQAIAASNHRMHITAWDIAFQGTSNSGTPIEVELVRQTSAGTVTDGTPVKANDGDDETLQSDFGYDATAEPSGTDVVWSTMVHPQTGYTWQAVPGRELVIKRGGRLGWRVTTSTAVDCSITVEFEE